VAGVLGDIIVPRWRETLVFELRRGTQGESAFSFGVAVGLPGVSAAARDLYVVVQITRASKKLSDSEQNSGNNIAADLHGSEKSD